MILSRKFFLSQMDFHPLRALMLLSSDNYIIGTKIFLCKCKRSHNQSIRQFTVSHINNSIFNIQFLKLHLHLLALFLIKDYVFYKKKLAFRELQLYHNHNVIAIVKLSNRSTQIFSVLIRELVWILEKRNKRVQKFHADSSTSCNILTKKSYLTS